MRVVRIVKSVATPVLFLVILMASFGVVGQASAQGSGVELDIPDLTNVAPNAQVVVPINYVSNGNEVTAATFSVDFDEQCLTYQNAEVFVPATVTGTASFNGADTDGEIDFTIFKFGGDPVPLVDGKIAEITFGTCGVVGTNVVNAPVLFSTSPTASFSDSLSADVPGTTDGGSVEIVPQIADLAVTKTANKDIVRAGGDIVYSLNVTNNGPLDATNVVLTDTLPAGTTYVSSNPGDPTCTVNGNQVTCSFDILTVGQSEQIEIVVVTDSGLEATIINNATASSDIDDPVTENSTATVDTNVTTSENIPSLSEWGLIGMAGLMIVVFTWRMGLVRRRMTRQVIRKD